MDLPSRLYIRLLRLDILGVHEDTGTLCFHYKGHRLDIMAALQVKHNIKNLVPVYF
jgi:hypothetical protein